MDIDEQIENTIKEYTIGYGCRVCGGGGSIDGNGKEVCSKCNGLGITGWEFKHCVPQIKQSILKAIMKKAPNQPTFYAMFHRYNQYPPNVKPEDVLENWANIGKKEMWSEFESVIKEVLQNK